MIILFVIIGGFVIVLFICALIDLLIQYEHDDRYPKIRFKSFKRFYEINPDRWVLKNSYVLCCKMHPVYGHIGLQDRFDFSFIDFVKYDIWKSIVRNNELEKEKMESVSRMLSFVKQDIEQLENQANAQTDQATDNIRNIINNM